MIVSCPHCSTRFNLPESQLKPGARLRCSVCKHVFDAPDADLPSEAPVRPVPSLDDLLGETGTGELDMHLDFENAEKPKKKSGGGFKKFLLVFLILGAFGGGGYAAWMYKPWQQFFPPEVPKQAEDLISLVALRGVRQYTINNEKVGPLSVIEGKTVNGFNAPRELMRVEAALYDKDGKMLVSKQQLAGTSVSLFQLQVLGEQELEQALANKIDVLTYNTNVAPGGEVPFMIVFYKPPDSAAEFGVKVVDARIPPEKK